MNYKEILESLGMCMDEISRKIFLEAPAKSDFKVDAELKVEDDQTEFNIVL